MTRSNARIPGWRMLAMGVLLLSSLALAAQDNSSAKPTLNHAQYFGVSAPLSELAKLPQPEQYGFHEAFPYRRIAKPHFRNVTDPVEQRTPGPASSLSPTLLASILGIGTGFPGYTVMDAPPDTNMAVGDWPGNEANAQVVQWVNVSYTICNKNPLGACTAVQAFNLLFPPASLCSRNDGDPIAQFDRDAHRWVLAQNVFIFPYAVCIAVSTTPSALGPYYVYQFSVPGNGFPDYPKWGIWSTRGQSVGYYQTQNDFGPSGSPFLGPLVCGYDRAKLLVGDPAAEQICFLLTQNEDSLLPADRDSPTPPPPTEDEFFIGSVADVNNSHLSLYSMHINNWASGSASFTGSPNTQLIAVAPYNGSCSGAFGGDCVPQLGVADRLDSLGDRLMYRFVYWQDISTCVTCPGGPKQHWLVNHDVESSTGQIGVRWYEFVAVRNAVPVTALTVNRQSTYVGVPADNLYRWMGSIARDNTGNILLGYSVSSAFIYPSIAVAEPSSPEVVAVAGTGSQVDTSGRWGDYSAMRIDPHDNCTLFYTTEYYMATTRFDWSTNISAWRFFSPPCP